MASNLSQDFVQADRFINRIYAQIPRDQELLLASDSEDTWFENLSRGPLAMVNVPPGVLENLHKLKSADLAQRSPRVQPATANVPSTPPRPTPGENNVENHQRTPDSWSQSQPHRGSDPSTQRGEETPPLRSSLVNPREDYQSKRKAPSVAVEVPPSSSAAQSEGLELQPPDALSQESGAPVNRPAVRAVATDLARPGATPPSAQEQIIPSTFCGTGQSEEQQSPAKKQRRMVETTDKESEPREQSRVSKASAKTLSMATGSKQGSSATNISTTSLPTQAASEHYRLSSLPKAASGSGAHRDSSSGPTPTWEGRHTAMATQRELLIQAPASSLTLPGPRPAQAAQRSSKPNSTRQSLSSARNSPTVRMPYEKFRMAYPDYQESAKTFVSALLTVERLKRDWALAEFLYDDFVRAFSTGYLQYITMSLVTDADQILTAVQWYNDNVKTVQYHQKVITKGNIHDLVKAHATEVRQVRESMGGSGSTVDEAAHEELDEELEIRIENDEQESDDQEPEAEREEEASVLASSPELCIDSPGTLDVGVTRAPVGSETSLISQVEPVNEEQPSYIVTTTVFDTTGQSSSEDTGLGNRSQRRFSFAKDVDETINKRVSLTHEKEASNLIQGDTRVDEAEGEHLLGTPDAEVEYAIEDSMSRSRLPPELHINSPRLEVTGVAASIEDEQPEEVNVPHQEAYSPSGSFASQEDVQMEDCLVDEEPDVNPESPIAIDRPRMFSESSRHSSEVVIAEGVHRNEETHEATATPRISKSSVTRDSVRESFTKVSTPVASETGSVPRKFLAPLPSSSRPPSRTRLTNTNGDETVHEGPSSPPLKAAHKSFSILADSSDEEEEAFDPPPTTVAIPKPWTATYSSSASQAQAPLSGNESDTFDTPIKVDVRIPRTTARSSPAVKPGTTSRTWTAPAASTATAAASKQTEFDTKVVRDHQRVASRVSTGSFSGVGKSGSPVSSERSHANVPLSKKRLNETREERSKRLKEHLRRRLAGKTPSSTPVGKQ